VNVSGEVIDLIHETTRPNTSYGLSQPDKHHSVGLSRVARHRACKPARCATSSFNPCPKNGLVNRLVRLVTAGRKQRRRKETEMPNTSARANGGNWKTIVKCRAFGKPTGPTLIRGHWSSLRGSKNLRPGRRIWKTGVRQLLDQKERTGATDTKGAKPTHYCG